MNANEWMSLWSHCFFMRDRLDKLLVAKGLATSRTKAAEIIERYGVRVRGHEREWVVFDKSWQAPEGAGVLTYELLSQDLNLYVSRGALKLASAIEHTSFEVKDKTIVDVGQSTGGFTDFCLRQGAKRVLGIEIGFDQLHPKLKQDPRVISLERTSAFDVRRDKLISILGESVDLVVADVSQVEMAELLPHILEWLPQSILLLLKPQYQRKIQAHYLKGRIDFSDPKLAEMCRQLAEEILEGREWNLVDFFPSSICGAEGSQEYWVHIKREQPCSKSD